MAKPKSLGKVSYKDVLMLLLQNVFTVIATDGFRMNGQWGNPERDSSPLLWTGGRHKCRGEVSWKCGQLEADA